MPEEVVRGAMLIRVNSLSRLVVVLQRKSSELMLLLLGDTLRSAFAFSRRSFASSRRESRPSFLSVARSLRVEICRLCVGRSSRARNLKLTAFSLAAQLHCWSDHRTPRHQGHHPHVRTSLALRTTHALELIPPSQLWQGSDPARSRGSSPARNRGRRYGTQGRPRFSLSEMRLTDFLPSLAGGTWSRERDRGFW